MESTSRFALRQRRVLGHKKMRLCTAKNDEDKENRGRKPLKRIAEGKSATTSFTTCQRRRGLRVVKPKIGMAPSSELKEDILEVPDTPSENPSKACKLAGDLPFAMTQINPNEFFDVSMETDSTSDGYEEDILSYLKEREIMILRSSVAAHPPLEKAHYVILVNWLVDVQVHLELQTDTLHLAVAMLDAYLLRRTISLYYLQLLGITCLFIAAKYEEIYIPGLDTLCNLCADTYKEKEFLTMERRILYTLDFNLFFPTAADFLGRYLTLTDTKDERLILVSNYLTDLTLTNFHCEAMPQSLLAAAAFFSALLMRRKETRHKSDAVDDQTLIGRLEALSGYEECYLTEIAKSILKTARAIKDTKHKAVYFKYNVERYQFISEDILKYSASLLDI